MVSYEVGGRYSRNPTTVARHWRAPVTFPVTFAFPSMAFEPPSQRDLHEPPLRIDTYSRIRCGWRGRRLLRSSGRMTGEC